MSEKVTGSLRCAFDAESQTCQRYSYLAVKLEEQASLAPTDEVVEILREAAQRLRGTGRVPARRQEGRDPPAYRQAVYH